MSRIIYARDYGILPDRYINSLKDINRMIADIDGDEETIIRFDTGRYILMNDECEEREIYITNTSSEKETKDKTKKLGILFENKKNITFDGNNSFFAINGEMIIIACINSTGIKFVNFASDYVRATVSEIKIDRLKFFRLDGTINRDCPYKIKDNRIIFEGHGMECGDSNAQLCDSNTGKTWRVFFSPTRTAGKVKDLAPYRIRICGFKRVPIDHVREGFTYQLRNSLRSEVGVFIDESQNISFDNVSFHFMHGLGIVGQFSENLTFDGIRCCPRTETGRTCSCFADFMHFCGCKGKIDIKNSYFNGSHDDAINVHGIHMMIKEKISDRRVLVEFMHPQTYGLAAFGNGDDVEGVDPISLNMQWANKVTDARLIDRYHMILDFVTPYDGIKVGQVIENVTRTPEVNIVHNVFEHIPTRGILVTTRRKVVIRRNRFIRTGMSAILISDDAKSWFESGRVMDVTIEKNYFNRCGYKGRYPVINVLPENMMITPNTPVHKNITIKDNEFVLDRTVAISVKSSEKLRISGNRYEGVHGAKPVYQFLASKDIEIENEDYTTGNRRIRRILTDKKEVKIQ